jgi:hypothetical protein
MSIGGGSSGGGPQGADPGAGRSRVEPLPVFTIKYGFTGGTEPTWPTTMGDMVVDSGGNTWRAIRARICFGSVTGVFNNATFEDISRVEDAGYFQYGTLTWLSGYNQGLSIEIRGFTLEPSPTFSLLEAMPYPIEEDDQFQVTMGCARTRTACKSFGNFRNHRGFPDMPTEEKALATPNYTQQGQQKEEDDSGS